MSEIRAFVSHYREQRGSIILITLLAVLGVGAEALLLVVLVPLASTITGASAAAKLGPFNLTSWTTGRLLLVALGAIVLVTVVQIGTVVLSARAAAVWQHTWRHRVFQAFLDADWATQSRDRDGKLVAVTGINIFQGAAGLTQMTNGISALIGVGVMTVAAFLVAPTGALLMLVSGGTLFLVLYPLSAFAKRKFTRMAAFNLDVSNTLSEYASLAREVRLYGVAASVDEAVSGELERHERLRKEATILVNSGSPLYRFGGVTLVLGLIWFATTRDASAALSFGTAALLLYRTVGYGQTLQRSYQAVHETLPYLRSTDDEIVLYETHPHVSGPVTLAPPERVEFRHVSFSYAPAAPDDAAEAGEVAPEVALDDLSVTLHRGEIIGLAGRSGAGKTTFAQLLLRLRQPTSGEVLIDGRVADEFTNESWADEVTLVPQDTRLIHGTVSANIRFLRPAITQAAIEQAARDAGIHDAILDLPDGYDTRIGPTTRNLSGGQIQRIGIARALAGSPSILVLDEPTSALDVQSELVIQETLERLQGSLLVVIIAHRLSTLSICNRVLVMERGRLRAEGPPDEVLPQASLLDVGADEPLAAPPEAAGLGSR